MECQECHKRPATLHFAQVVNGQKTEVHMCETCAKEKGYMASQDEGYSLHDLLFGLFNYEPSITPKEQKPQQSKESKECKCPKCGLTFSEFKKIGKFGCATCYYTFSSKLDPIFRRVHSGNTQHQGKIPKRKGGSLHIKKQIAGLKEELQHLITEEAFEEAAKVRDQIKVLEKENQEGRKEAGDES